MDWASGRSLRLESVYIHDRGEAFHLREFTQQDIRLGGEEGLEGDMTVDLDEDSLFFSLLQIFMYLKFSDDVFLNILVVKSPAQA